MSLNIPIDTCVIEINSSKTIALWTRDFADVRLLFQTINSPTLQFFRVEDRQGYFHAYAQFYTSYEESIHEGSYFIPAVSSVTIGEKLETLIANTVRYSRNCIPYRPWCNFDNKHQLFN